MKAITIIGGGIAGLSLGICLRRFLIPVAIYEAADYPLKKVCGEFLSGLPFWVIEKLGIEDILGKFPQAQEASFTIAKKRKFVLKFLFPVYLTPRETLDSLLARRFVDLGGTLYTRSFCPYSFQEGVVVACGKKKEAGQWIGLKVHLRGVKLDYDLEMYAATQGYLGLCKIDSQTVNLCGLFKKTKVLAQSKRDLFRAYLKLMELTQPYIYFENSQFIEESFAAIPSFALGFHPHKEQDVKIGDSFVTVPPFMGNGMAMAMESAAIATDDLVLYAQGKLSWPQAIKNINRKLKKRFFSRVYLGLFLHPQLMKEQSWLLPLLSQQNVVNSFYRLTRAWDHFTEKRIDGKREKTSF
ncbi:NAD(P)/FAD-dependent oxidoreductase [Methylacidiphilum caldifontis]|uniref:Dehydrogenase n=1 Tax=Methylacidiphilum caldifontis TaxID=2795386 RepID=A0A4Y8PAQ1_9BACT|nr:dehydrogenase [Methylacidiphilum caldifontis]TFE68009.1 dehydrogenase [Methylacidiphilum caldifontis]